MNKEKMNIMIYQVIKLFQFRKSKRISSFIKLIIINIMINLIFFF
jgi:Na+-transporting NADH:ubiquinone oxidoreductase subunit NqrD